MRLADAIHGIFQIHYLSLHVRGFHLSQSDYFAEMVAFFAQSINYLLSRFHNRPRRSLFSE